MPKITEMYAFVVADKDENDEGIIGFAPDPKAPTAMMPMVGADMARIESLRPLADRVSAQIGKPYKILRFKLVGEKKSFWRIFG